MHQSKGSHTSTMTRHSSSNKQRAPALAHLLWAAWAYYNSILLRWNLHCEGRPAATATQACAVNTLPLPFFALNISVFLLWRPIGTRLTNTVGYAGEGCGQVP